MPDQSVNLFVVGPRAPCLSSPQLMQILKNETVTNCPPESIVTELAYSYNTASNACYPAMIFVCLDYPNEPYRIRILGRPLIFESQMHCEAECHRAER